jgi:glutamate-5-semialdehyde dehydrogenase
MNELPESYSSRLQESRQGARAAAALSTEKKNRVLSRAGELLMQSKKHLLEANARDLGLLGREHSSAFRDRLTLTEARIDLMAESLVQIARLPDPVGEVAEDRTLSNGLRTRRMRAPLGVIFMIFESRPNVAIESFALAFKAGNAIWLRGGKESKESVVALLEVMKRALEEEGVPESVLTAVSDPGRALVMALLQQKDWIDVVVPRGGDRLIEFVVQNSRIPIIKNDRGMCHVYVHSDADLNMAQSIVENAKTQRPGVCNAMETLLVHAAVAPVFLPALFEKITLHSDHPVHWYACERSRAILPKQEQVHAAKPAHFDTEYLDYKMNCRIVDSIDDALEHISKHGSRHSEAIITNEESSARRFQQQVDAAAVYWNASTRFTDGFELGLGGELGISTQKLHVRGPVGLRELTSLRWVIDGKGQVRK